ncbi:carboxylesterase family protein [Flammeovirga agarivorans]|uniref:Dienelactone hydrolase domain-containing protein n=1 Tax=Flammeovirga agarivorans TaxID=2726742 RepID=A0A7X8SP40_9BACT|nr:dienelactone hydrolase family protein [Flammeovirga agarivorans]NLR93791.1 hypothetical protein [Flammeovirga agarivorans]
MFTQLRRKAIYFHIYQYFIILLFISMGFYSCDNTSTEAVIPTSSTVSSNNEEDDLEQPEILPLAIDSSDLVVLPLDTGGVHKAFTLGATPAVFGHYIYTPSGYTDSGAEYPLLVFLHGWDPSGYTGSDFSELNELQQGVTPPGLISEGKWNPSFPFIVASPRLKSYDYWRPQDVHSFINYLIQEYQVNTSRIYITGLSLGGGGAWYYVGVMGTENYAAAIVPISARGEPSIVTNLSKVPIWAFHGDSDTTVPHNENFGSVPLVSAINARNPEVKAKITVFNNTGHDAWSRVYSDNFTKRTQGDPFTVSIYDWLLQYKKENLNEDN